MHGGVDAERLDLHGHRRRAHAGHRLAAVRDHVAALVGAHREPEALATVLDDGLRHERRGLDRGGGQQDALDADAHRPRDVLGAAHAAAELHAHGQRAQPLHDRPIDVSRLVEQRVHVDDVQPLRALLDPVARGGDRIVAVVDRPGAFVVGGEVDEATAPQVQGGEYLERPGGWLHAGARIGDGSEASHVGGPAARLLRRSPGVRVWHRAGPVAAATPCP